MKLFLPVVALSVLTVSCSRYQYITINSPTIQQNDKQEFVVENDTLSITYNFNGVNAPVNMHIRNKLDKPVYIDWQRSSLIVNDNAISYMSTQVNITGTTNSSGINWSKDFSTSGGTLSATATIPASWQFIPPKSYVTKTPMSVTNEFFTNLPDSVFHQVNRSFNDGTRGFIKQAVFTETNSPLRFKSYLTVMVGGENMPTPVAYEHFFYIANLVRTGIQPGNFIPWNTPKKGNEAYVRETTGFGTGFGVVAGTAVLAAVSVANDRINNTQNSNK